MTKVHLRFRLACYLPLLLSASGCTGGQTTVPAGNPCVPRDAGALEAPYLGTHEIEVSWQRSTTGADPIFGSTRLTMKLPPSIVASTCDSEWSIPVELATEDGVLTFSGTGQLTQISDTTARLMLEPASGVVWGRLDLRDSFEAVIDFVDGSWLSAHQILSTLMGALRYPPEA